MGAYPVSSMLGVAQAGGGEIGGQPWSHRELLSQKTHKQVILHSAQGIADIILKIKSLPYQGKTIKNERT